MKGGWIPRSKRKHAWHPHRFKTKKQFKEYVQTKHGKTAPKADVWDANSWSTTHAPTLSPTSTYPTPHPTSTPTMSVEMDQKLRNILTEMANGTLVFTGVPTTKPTAMPTIFHSLAPTLTPTSVPTFNQSEMPAWIRDKYHVTNKGEFAKLFSVIAHELKARTTSAKARVTSAKPRPAKPIPFAFKIPKKPASSKEQAMAAKYHMKVGSMRKMHQMISSAKATSSQSNEAREIMKTSSVHGYNKAFESFRRQHEAKEAAAKAASVVDSGLPQWIQDKYHVKSESEFTAKMSELRKRKTASYSEQVSSFHKLQAMRRASASLRRNGKGVR
jgi:tellurite resistance-related uncharacterized protein